MRRWGAFFAAAFLWACAAPRAPQLGDPPPKVADGEEEKAYQKVFERYTSEKEIYAKLDTQIFGGMTSLSWPFREAKVKREAEILVLTQVEKDQRLGEEKAAFDSAHEFFFGVHVNTRKYDDFDRRDSIWRLALVTPQMEVLPLSVERIGRSSLPMRAMYPYVGDFWVGYLVRFPKEASGMQVIPPGTPGVTVRLSSTLGRADFTFPSE